MHAALTTGASAAVASLRLGLRTRFDMLMVGTREKRMSDRQRAAEGTLRRRLNQKNKKTLTVDYVYGLGLRLWTWTTFMDSAVLLFFTLD